MRKWVLVALSICTPSCFFFSFYLLEIEKVAL